ncbi:MAG: shikimate kinase [Pyrinomonadaceae bacterium]
MDKGKRRIILTGFMGVGKTTIAKHLSYLIRKEREDLDDFIARKEDRSTASIISTGGEAGFREIETKCLKELLESDVCIISLGGGAWTLERNREIISEYDCMSIWLESTFEHCWRNIRLSRFERPLAKDKERARKLFDERVKFYCLAEWHFVIKPGNNSFDIAKQIATEYEQIVKL